MIAASRGADFPIIPGFAPKVFHGGAFYGQNGAKDSQNETSKPLLTYESDF
jgi:hypothetical protein